MRTPSTLLLVFIFLIGVAWDSVEAQVPGPPGRPHRGLFGGGRPPDPDRSRQQLAITADALVGYDDNLRLGEGANFDPLSRPQPGYRRFGSAAVRYGIGRDARSLATTGKGYLTAFSTHRRANIGGDVQVEGTTALGRSNRLSADANVSYVPFFTIGAFGSLSDDMDRGLSPDANPLNGLAGQESWQSSASVTVGRQWTPHNNTSVKYTHATRDYLGKLGYDSEEQALSAGYTRVLGRALNLTASYYHSEFRLLGVSEAGRPITQQSVWLEATYRRRLSRNRSMSFSGGAGATQTQQQRLIGSVNGRSRSPSGHGSVGLDVGRTWTVKVDYRRTVSVLDAIAPDPFETDAAFLSLSGLVGRRLEVALASGYSAGRQASIVPYGEHDSRSLGARLVYGLTRSIGATASYTYYEHRVRGFHNALGGLPPQFARSVVNVGISVWLPLYGTWAAIQRPASGRS